ncbi:MAG: gamma-glutamyltransferase [Proteobacteria bacterium]|nr:gamma-glutamyltransferase [Pseudomonadota bacterium]
MWVRGFVSLTVFCCVLLAACAPADQTSSVTPVSPAAFAMPDRYGADVAELVLRAGGNAVDAAIATAFSLAVTYPEAGNIGGGGFMLIYVDGQSYFLDYREVAPAAASRDMYLDENGDVVPGLSRVGHRATGVPGTVAGMWAAHQRFGSMAWAELLAPAIDLAENGFVADKMLAARTKRKRKTYAGKTNFDRYFGKLEAGAVFSQPELAETLRRIAANGRAGFYQGETAVYIVDEMQRGGGLISMDDLIEYRPVWREPLKASWRDYQLLSAPPPSSGGFAIIQLLKMKDYLAGEFDGLAHNSAQYVHLIAEMEKRVFADRAEYFGDPDFVVVPIGKLIADDYIEARAAEVDRDAISSIDSVPPGLESPHTTHFSIADKDGNAVSNTYTLNSIFGSGVIVEGAGFVLNNEMDDFSAKPGAPNIYGVVGKTANKIQPGKRMLSSMSPTILLQDGEISMVLGTPGGSTIFTTVFQAIVNILDFGMTPEEAAGASRFHHQLLPPDLVTYSRSRPLSDQTIKGLIEKGYRTRPHRWDYGDLQIVWRDGDSYRVASDPRKRGEARVLH